MRIFAQRNLHNYAEKLNTRTSSSKLVDCPSVFKPIWSPNLTHGRGVERRTARVKHQHAVDNLVTEFGFQANTHLAGSYVRNGVPSLNF